MFCESESIELYELLASNVIRITVAEGTAKPYFLKKNGMKPSGVYVRQGTSSVPATWEQIRNFIKYSDGDSFESERSLEQDFTFNAAKSEFENRNVPFTEDKYISLGLRNAERNLFTNLAFLLSDQCLHSVKVAVFEDSANTIFIDRREFSGSIFKQLHDAYQYLMLNNRTVSVIRGLDRIDHMDYPPEAIREALLNALIHRDYSFSGSIIINVNKERMEFISLGGLLPGLSKNDILNGISQPRNTKLAQVFFRLKHIEAYGTGIRRIFELYKSTDTKPEITVSDNTFRISLPNMNYNKKPIAPANHKLPDQMQKVVAYLGQNAAITDEDLMDLLELKRTRAYLVAKQMVSLGIIDVIGRGKDKKYVFKR